MVLATHPATSHLVDSAMHPLLSYPQLPNVIGSTDSTNLKKWAVFPDGMPYPEKSEVVDAP